MRFQPFLPLLLAMMVWTAGCATPRPAASKWSPDFSVRREVLDNGLTVLFVEDHSVPVVSYATWFKVGSAWEKPGHTGIAHLFEHMMFKGTPRFSAKAFFEKLESKGALVNAYTQRDATVYYEVIPSQNLELVIDMESDRLANLLFSQADLDSERKVVKEERRLRVESNFAAQHAEALQRAAFPDHPYGWPVIGYQEDLDRLTLDECREFFKTYYQPGNAIVTVAGDFDYAQTKAWIRKYYGPLRGRQVPELKLPGEKLPGREVRLSIRRPVEAQSVLIGYHIPSMYEPDSDRLSMLAWALFGMSSSRANLRLVREARIALSVGAEAFLETAPGLFIIAAEMKTGIPASRAVAEIERIVDDAQAKVLSEEELERVKNGLTYSVINETKSPAGLANWVASGEFYWKNHRRVFEKLAVYQAMTTGELREVARKYLRRENRVLVTMKPKAASAKGGPE